MPFVGDSDLALPIALSDFTFKIFVVIGVERLENSQVFFSWLGQALGDGPAHQAMLFGAKPQVIMFSGAVGLMLVEHIRNGIPHRKLAPISVFITIRDANGIFIGRWLTLLCPFMGSLFSNYKDKLRQETRMRRRRQSVSLAKFGQLLTADAKKPYISTRARILPALQPMEIEGNRSTFLTKVFWSTNRS